MIGSEIVLVIDIKFARKAKSIWLSNQAFMELEVVIA
jgi:hypothetical protein